MPSTDLDISDGNQVQPPAKTSKDAKNLRITGKNKAAIDAMVWQGLKRADAAQVAGLKDHALYVAMTKPHVKAYYLSQCEMLRTSGRARRIHRLNDMVEQNDNKAAVINAALALESMGNDQASVSAQQKQSPGVVIQIINAPAQPVVRTIEHDPVTHD